MTKPRERLFLALTAALAIGAPAGAAAWVDRRTDRLADELGAAAGVPASIGRVDADLTGTVRLSDVALGGLVAADQIEASVALDSLLAGEPAADEIRVSHPRLSAEIDANGDSDLGRLVRRLSARRTGGSPAGTAGGPSRVRRIVVTSGSLVARVAGVGELTADDVELVPDEAGVRVITGEVRVRGGAGGGRVAVELAFARSAADVTLPQLHVARALAVAGTGTATLGDRAIPLRDVAAGRLRRGGPLEVRASVDDGGVPRDVAVDLAPDLALVLHGDRVPLGVLSGLAPHGVELDGAHGTGTLTLLRREGGLRVELDGSVAGLRIDHRSIAAGPVPIDARVRGAMELAADGFVVDDTTIAIGGATWTVAGWLRRNFAPAGQLDLSLAPAPCNDLLASLPAELRGPLDGMAMTGTLGGHARIAIDLGAPPGEGVQLETALLGGCQVATEAPAADVSALSGPGEQIFADGSTARVGRGTPSWTELARLPGHVPAAFVAAEDAAFWDHHGFDLVQIARSLEIDLREHRIARGGSTISQQLIKNTFLSQRRSLDRKIQEAVLTWRLEQRLDKRAILERYVNVIELGPRVFGIGAAAKFWFGIPASQLTLHQAAFLAAMTSEPSSMSRRVRHAGGLDPDTATRVDIVLRGMRIAGAIDDEQMMTAHTAPMFFAPTALARE